MENVNKMLRNHETQELIRALREALSSNDRDRSSLICDALRNLDDPSSIEPLIEMIDFQQATAIRDPFMQQPVIELLGYFGDARAIPVLVSCLQNSSTYDTAVEALGLIGDPYAADAIVSACPVEGSRPAAISLGRLKDSRAYEFIIRELERPNLDASHKDRLIEALGASGDARAIDYLSSQDYSYQSTKEKRDNALARLNENPHDYDFEPNSVEIIEAESDTLETARTIAQTRIPNGYIVISEIIISDGNTQTISADGETFEEAFTTARKLLPANAQIVEKKELVSAKKLTIPVEAYDEPSATAQAAEAIFGIDPQAKMKSVRLTRSGSSGIFGVGKKPNQYEAEAVRPATFEIHYRLPAKVNIKVGKVDELFAGKSINRWIHELNYQDTGRRAERALIRIGAPAVPGLIRKADAESPIMHAAIYILSRIDDPMAFEALIAKVAHSNASVRLAAAYVLGKSGDQRAAKVLLDALLRENTTTQSTLARALADIGDLSVVEPMIGYLNDKLSDLLPKTVLVSVQGRNMDPMLGVIDALGQMMDSRAVNSLVIALEKGDHLVRQASARALGRIKDPHSVGALIQALDYEYVGSYAAQALGEIGDSSAVEALKLAADKGSISRIDLKNALKAIQIRSGDNEG